jgi:hypothetical protein
MVLVAAAAHAAAALRAQHGRSAWCHTHQHPPTDKASFDAALVAYWRDAVKPGERMPQPINIDSKPVDPYMLWREVWSWGGPTVCSQQKVREGEGGKGRQTLQGACHSTAGQRFVGWSVLACMCLTLLRVAAPAPLRLPLQLWATVGASFHPPLTATSVSTRMMRFYDAMLAGFDKV